MSIGTKIGDCIFKTVGIMNTKVIARKCGEIGKQAGELAKEKGYAEPQEIQSILNGILGKRANKIKLSGDKETCINEVQKRLYLTRERAEIEYAVGGNCVLPAQRKEPTLLNLQLENLKNEALPNIAAHESEHAMYDAFSIRRIFERKYMSYFPKLNERIGKIFGEMLSTKSTDAQQALIHIDPRMTPLIGLTDAKYCPNAKTTKKMKNNIKGLLYAMGILNIGKDKQNALIASCLKMVFLEEKRAYSVGGKAEREFYKNIGKNSGECATSSDLRSTFYKIFADIFREEAKHAKINKLKLKFGLKPDYSTEQKLADNCIAKVQKKRKEKQEVAKVKNEFAFWENALNWAG